MTQLTIRTFALAVCLATPCLAATFSKESATRAIEKLMPSDGPKEFVMFNLADPKSKSDQLLYMMKEAREENVCLALCAPKLGSIRDLLTSTLEEAKAEKLDGLYLLVVADEKDLPGFKELVKGRGIHVKCGIYK